ncbi:MAG: hypothetical protein RR585_05385, partial [Coprobacillus sp.]
ITSGNQFEVEIYPEFTRKQSVHAAVKRKTYDAQKNLNDKNSRKKLQRLLNTNFGNGDIWATFNCDDKHLPKDINDARRIMCNYIARINYQRKKLGKPPSKYVYIIEYNERKKIRWHFHLVMDGEIDMNIVERTWKCGRRNHLRIIAKDDKGLIGLADYLSKEPQGSKRWASSLNLKKPTIRKNHQTFRMKQIREMIENRNRIRELIEKKFHGMTYIDESARYNEINGRTYIHVRLSINDEGGDRLRE